MADCRGGNASRVAAGRPLVRLTAPQSRKAPSLRCCSSDGWRSPASQQLAHRISSSYTRATARPLLPDLGREATAEDIFNAPFVLVAHDGVGAAADANFNYANRLGLEAFEATWDEWVGRPSRLSAGSNDDEQAMRNQYLDASASSGLVVFQPEIVRVSVKGRRFRAFEVEVFNVRDESGAAVGQAAVLRRFVRIDS